MYKPYRWNLKGWFSVFGLGVPMYLYVERERSTPCQCVSITIYNNIYLLTICCTHLHLWPPQNILECSAFQISSLDVFVKTVLALVTLVCVYKGLLELIIGTQADC